MDRSIYLEEKMIEGNKRTRKAIAKMKLNENSVFIDGGAHRGEELAVLCEIGCEVHSFEVNPIHCENLEIIYSGYEKVKINHAALWVENTYIDVYEKATNKLSSMTTENSKRNIDKKKSISVRAIDIAEYISSLDKEVDVMKLDIEGGEYKVIKHLIETKIIDKIKVIYFEDHEEQMKTEKPKGKRWKAEKKQVLELMRPYKYKLKGWW
tara:strand:- start:812 stop:1438 length:627 start_codon:yes stop_codon:yes gene_type:complete